MSKTLFFFKPKNILKLIFALILSLSVLIRPATVSATSSGESFYTGCDPGYYINPATGRCVKIKVCKVGYAYDAATNSCYKLTCPFGYKITDSTGLCRPLVCNDGYTLSLSTGNCVKAPANFDGCPPGEAYDGSKKTCRAIYPEDAPACSDDEYLNRSSSECLPIYSPLEYDSWLTTELVSTNDSTTVTNGAISTSSSLSSQLTSPALPDTSNISLSDHSSLNPLDASPSISASLPVSASSNSSTTSSRLALAPLGRAATASSSGHTTALADISSPEYDELRDLISAYLEEQAALEAEEESPNDLTPDDPSSDEPDSNSDSNSDAESPAATEKVCPEGKVLNPATNRCRNAVTVTETSTTITTTVFDPVTGETTTTKTCVAGYSLNPETNRCTKNSTISSSTTKTCPEGQYLNPETNRCKKLSTTTVSATSTTVTTYDPLTGETTTIKTCIEGYELNPDTNRCVKAKNNDGADYSLDVPDLGTIESSPKVFIAVAVVASLVAIGLGALIFQFRHDLVRIFRKIFKK